MEQSKSCPLDTREKVRGELEWVYFALKRKEIKAGEADKLVRILDRIESLMAKEQPTVVINTNLDLPESQDRSEQSGRSD